MILGGVLLAIAVVGSLTSLFIRKVPASGSTEPFHWNPFGEIWSGTKELYRDRPLWLTVLGISYFWFVGALFQLTVILDGSESLHLSETHTGLLVTALAVGIGLGSIAAGWLSGDRVEVGLVPVGAAALGLCSILLGSTHSFGSTMVWLAFAGFAGGLFIVPLNAFLQDRAAPEEKGRLLATNNFLNMFGVVAASGVLYLAHDLLHWTPAHILAAAGVLTLAATLYITWIVPASLLRLLIRTFTQLFFRIRVIGAENLPRKGGRPHRLQPRLLRRRDSDRLRQPPLDPFPDVAAVVREQVAESGVPPLRYHPSGAGLSEGSIARPAPRSRRTRKRPDGVHLPGRRNNAHVPREALRTRRRIDHARSR